MPRLLLLCALLSLAAGSPQLGCDAAPGGDPAGVCAFAATHTQEMVSVLQTQASRGKGTSEVAESASEPPPDPAAHRERQRKVASETASHHRIQQLIESASEVGVTDNLPDSCTALHDARSCQMPRCQWSHIGKCFPAETDPKAAATWAFAELKTRVETTRGPPLGVAKRRQTLVQHMAEIDGHFRITKETEETVKDVISEELRRMANVSGPDAKIFKRCTSLVTGAVGEGSLAQDFDEKMGKIKTACEDQDFDEKRIRQSSGLSCERFVKQISLQKSVAEPEYFENPANFCLLFVDIVVPIEGEPECMRFLEDITHIHWKYSDEAQFFPDILDSAHIGPAFKKACMKDAEDEGVTEAVCESRLDQLRAVPHSNDTDPSDYIHNLCKAVDLPLDPEAPEPDTNLRQTTRAGMALAFHRIGKTKGKTQHAQQATDEDLIKLWQQPQTFEDDAGTDDESGENMSALELVADEAHAEELGEEELDGEAEEEEEDGEKVGTTSGWGRRRRRRCWIAGGTACDQKAQNIQFNLNVGLGQVTVGFTAGKGWGFDGWTWGKRDHVELKEAPLLGVCGSLGWEAGLSMSVSTGSYGNFGQLSEWQKYKAWKVCLIFCGGGGSIEGNAEWEWKKFGEKFKRYNSGNGKSHGWEAKGQQLGGAAEQISNEFDKWSPIEWKHYGKITEFGAGFGGMSSKKYCYVWKVGNIHRHEVNCKGGNIESCSGCFPASATVRTPSGPRALSELRVGDKVSTVDEHGRLVEDEIYFFGHAQRAATFPYLRLELGGTNASVQLSAQHFIQTCPERGQACEWWEHVHRYAEEVRPGDYIWEATGSSEVGGALELRAVRSVSHIIEEGLYNPYSISGMLIVDGVVASAHSDWVLDKRVPPSWSPWLPAIYQALFLPGRCLYRTIRNFPGARDWVVSALDVNNPQAQPEKFGRAPEFLAAALTFVTLAPLASASWVFLRK